MEYIYILTMCLSSLSYPLSLLSTLSLIHSTLKLSFHSTSSTHLLIANNFSFVSLLPHFSNATS